MQVVYLTIAGETVVTTADHPFYTAENEWLEAGKLTIGDDIRTALWTTGEVEAISVVDQPQRMYNFTVATAHTYFVGNGQWLVHNSGGLCNHTNGQWLVHNSGGLCNHTRPTVENELLQKNIVNEIFRSVDEVPSGTAGILLREGTISGVHGQKAQ